VALDGVRAAAVQAPRFAAATNDLDLLTYRQAQDFVRDLERAGVSMLWVAEVLGREAFTAAQLALAATNQLVVASGVARALERVPKSAAAAQATLCEGFPGRYLLGLGVSGAARERGVAPLPFMRGYLDELDANTRRLTGRDNRLPRVLGGYAKGLTGLARDHAEGLLTTLVTSEHTTWARAAWGRPAPTRSRSICWGRRQPTRSAATVSSRAMA